MGLRQSPGASVGGAWAAGEEVGVSGDWLFPCLLQKKSHVLPSELVIPSLGGGSLQGNLAMSSENGP